MAMAGSPGLSGYSGYTDQRCCILEPRFFTGFEKAAEVGVSC